MTDLRLRAAWLQSWQSEKRVFISVCFPTIKMTTYVLIRTTKKWPYPLATVSIPHTQVYRAMQEDVAFRASELKHSKWEVVGQSQSIPLDPDGVISWVRAAAQNERTPEISLLISTKAALITPKRQFPLRTHWWSDHISNCSPVKADWLPNRTRSPEKAFDHPLSLPWTPPRLSGPAACWCLPGWLHVEEHLCKPSCSKKNSIVQRKSPAWQSWERTLNYYIF